uniref:ATP-grasp domain-containing protein n=1 Tax=Myripristis murdjan TaxID=586833 RepID=A0A667WZH1_9TELE
LPGTSGSIASCWKKDLMRVSLQLSIMCTDTVCQEYHIPVTDELCMTVEKPVKNLSLSPTPLPGDALLCFSPSWLSCSSSSLLVHKAVTFDLGGRTFLTSFNPPRVVTYFLSCDPFSAEEVTRGVDCPMGTSGSLGMFWGDVLTSRFLLEKAKIHTPTTLALLMPSEQTVLEEGTMGGLELVHLATTVKDDLNSIRNKVDSFLDSETMRLSDKVVLRCSGGRFVSQGAAASTPIYLPKSNRDEVWARVDELLPSLLPGEAVLLETYCPPLKGNDAPGGPDLSFRVCAIVTRSPQNVPLLYKVCMVCRVGASDTPLSHHQSLSQSLETTLSECGFTDPALAASIRRLATNTALDCLRVIMETEASMSSESRGGLSAQTDMIGVDLIFTSDGSTIKPVVLGFHPSLCLQSSIPEQRTVKEIFDRETEACRGTLLLTPFTRSQCYLMQEKTVLVVGAGSYSKKFIWEAAKHYKIKILLVDSDPKHFASKMVDHFLPLPDLPDHRRDDQHCIYICDWLSTSGLHPDGCVCFWDDCVVLTSLICDRLGLRGSHTMAVGIAKEKSRTHLHLLSSFHPSVPLLSPSPSSYAVPCLHVESRLFPAVMKLEYGAGAVGVRKVGSLSESLAHFERIAGDLREETDYPGIGLGWGNAMTLMEYVGGTEHDVDLMLFNGQLEGAFVSDNGPTRAPTFTETAAQMPSGLAPDKRAQLIRAAYHACLGCGLRDGVYNVELKMTKLGPRLIEINARMGGFYLRDWILQLYGVDLLMAAFMIACGVRPRLPSATDLPARGHFVGVMCVVSQHLQALRSTASPQRLRSLHQEGALWLNELAADDELIAGEYEEPFCNVGVRDTCSRERACQRLLALCQGLGLHCPPRYDLEYFLSHFH